MPDGAGNVIPRKLQWSAIDRVLHGSWDPLLCQMEDNNGPAGLWVVKPPWFKGRSKPLARELLAELAGASVCTMFGLPCPEIGLVKIPLDIRQDDVAHLDPGMRKKAWASLSINLGQTAFCSRYVQGSVDMHALLLRRKSKQAEVLDQCLRLIGIDAFLANDDRTRDTPNTLWFRDQVVPIDHGDALPSLDTAEPGELAATRFLEANKVRQHVAFLSLRKFRHELDFDLLREIISNITDQQVDVAQRRWPAWLDSLPSPRIPLRRNAAVFLKARRAQVDAIIQRLRCELVP